MDPEADDQAMAQMMGFSSFGAQDRPQKKRKYNPGADASVGAPPVPAASTGSNSVPVGTRKPVASANADEIDLGDDEADGADAGAGDQAAPVVQPTAASSETPHSLPHGLPQRPAPGVGQGAGHGPGQGGHQDRRHGGGDGHVWYEGYYDTLSNRNPWEKLEKAMGLESKGTWISHEAQAAAQVEGAS